MAFSVEDFHDLVALLEQQPGWRADLRRLLLTEDLLALPDTVRRLMDAQERSETRLEKLEAAVQKLADAQERTEVRLGELASAQQQTEIRLGELAKAQERTEVRLGELVDAVLDLKSTSDRSREAISSDGTRSGCQLTSAVLSGAAMPSPQMNAWPCWTRP
ncbi:MAG TPA: hypothetical protein VHX16_15290 [Chloroflexota bacterium]|jgi:chromosome segregation ATPase|nr:hypothetical protein [Chloroflexota bacterium]